MFLFSLAFVLILCTVLLLLFVSLVQFIRNAIQWGRNNASPRLTVEALVTSKRTEFRRHRGGKGGARGRLSFQGTRYLGFQRD